MLVIIVNFRKLLCDADHILHERIEYPPTVRRFLPAKLVWSVLKEPNKPTNQYFKIIFHRFQLFYHTTDCKCSQLTVSRQNTAGTRLITSNGAYYSFGQFSSSNRDNRLLIIHGLSDANVRYSFTHPNSLM